MSNPNRIKEYNSKEYRNRYFWGKCCRFCRRSHSYKKRKPREK